VWHQAAQALQLHSVSQVRAQRPRRAAPPAPYPPGAPVPAARRSCAESGRAAAPAPAVACGSGGPSQAGLADETQQLRRAPSHPSLASHPPRRAWARRASSRSAPSRCPRRATPALAPRARTRPPPRTRAAAAPAATARARSGSGASRRVAPSGTSALLRSRRCWAPRWGWLGGLWAVGWGLAGSLGWGDAGSQVGLACGLGAACGLGPGAAGWGVGGAGCGLHGCGLWAVWQWPGLRGELCSCVAGRHGPSLWPHPLAAAEVSRACWRALALPSSARCRCSTHVRRHARAPQAGPTPELQALVQEKERGQQLLALIRQGKEAAALELLASSSKLAWAKDASNGAYPLHAAIQKGQAEVVRALLQINGARLLGLRLGLGLQLGLCRPAAHGRTRCAMLRCCARGPPLGADAPRLLARARAPRRSGAPEAGRAVAAAAGGCAAGGQGAAPGADGAAQGARRQGLLGPACQQAEPSRGGAGDGAGLRGGGGRRRQPACLPQQRRQPGGRRAGRWGGPGQAAGRALAQQAGRAAAAGRRGAGRGGQRRRPELAAADAHVERPAVRPRQAPGRAV
jgi:hypothetical protein